MTFQGISVVSREMPAGRPPTFDSADKLQEEIDRYFKEGITVKTIIIGKAPNQQAIEVEVPTITGLCHFLGFESRQSFYAYEKKDGFSYTIKKARLFIERHYEEMLQTGNTIGAIFALKNFDWRDKQEIEQSGGIKVSFADPGDYIYPAQDKSDSGIPESV